MVGGGNPDSPERAFEFHPVKFAESGGAQMFAYDFDGDGDNDVVSSQNAHGYGLCWFERRGNSPDDFLFVKHSILGAEPSSNPYGVCFSQLHALALADMDGDGVKDLVTGKRFWRTAEKILALSSFRCFTGSKLNAVARRRFRSDAYS